MLNCADKLIATLLAVASIGPSPEGWRHREAGSAARVHAPTPRGISMPCSSGASLDPSPARMRRLIYTFASVCGDETPRGAGMAPATAADHPISCTRGSPLASAHGGHGRIYWVDEFGNRWQSLDPMFATPDPPAAAHQ